VRLFVAVWPPPAVVQLLESLPRPHHRDVRWTGPDQWHVTLRFLGEVDEEQVPALVESLAAHLAVVPPPDVLLGPVSRRLGRAVLMLPVTGLDDVAAAVLEATAGVVPLDDPRPFTGHLTLARGRRRAAVPAALARAPASAGWRVDEVALVRSRTHPAGARYDDVAGFPLAGEGA
jgi:2'-5' RNA ligase